MTLALIYRVIEKRNFHESMEMSFFTWNMEMSFFGMPLYILDVCPENRDESNGNSNFRLWLQFIPIFGPCTRSYVKGIQQKKISPYSFPYPVSQERLILVLHFMVIHERNWIVSTEMSFFVLCPHRCGGVALIIGI